MESDPGKELREVWVYLTPDEAEELRRALDYWADEDPSDPGWHCHVTDTTGRELTVAIGEPDDPAFR